MNKKLRKRLYRFFSIINRIHIRIPAYLIIGFSIVILFLIGCMLPIHKESSAYSENPAQAELAAFIRTAVKQSSNDKAPVDVVVLFENKDTSSFYQDSCLYSMYVTGKELHYLAESNVSIHQEHSSSIMILDGLDYSYHASRLPLNRITALSFTDQQPLEKEQLYRLVSTDEIFSLISYLDYRSQGLMEIQPKNENGILLAEYEVMLFDAATSPLTISRVKQHFHDESYKKAEAIAPAVSSVAQISGFNLITLIIYPNQITLYIFLLAITLLLLALFIVPRLKRIRLWIRIHTIRCHKRAYRSFGRRRIHRTNSHSISRRHVA